LDEIVGRYFNQFDVLAHESDYAPEIARSPLDLRRWMQLARNGVTGRPFRALAGLDKVKNQKHPAMERVMDSFR
jgi:hypothetical protein